MGHRLNVAAVLALGLAVSFMAMNGPTFLVFAIHADTLYPALLVEDLRSDPSALFRFQPSRVPSFVPDVGVAALIDALTGNWRLGFWGYGGFAFVMLSLLGGWIGRQVFGEAARAASVWLALILAGFVVGALLQQAGLAALGGGVARPEPLRVNLHALLMMPVWQSGAFIAGVGVLCLIWRAMQRPGWAGLCALGVLTALATASNTIIIAHAVLPGLIALADGVWRGYLARRAALWAGAILALAVLAGFGLGLLVGRHALPVGAGSGLLAGLRALPPDLLREPAQLLMLLTCLPIALAFFLPKRAVAWLPAGGHAAALRFFVVAAAAACGAAVTLTALLYFGPHAWRYGNPVAWWPAIFLAGMLAARSPRRVSGLGLLMAGGVAAASAFAGGSASPAVMRWRPAELACLDAEDPAVTWRAGLAAYWQARTIAAASGWQRQVESIDFGEGRPFLWIEDSRSVVQQRHAAPGTPPPYRFILMTGLDPQAITRLHGAPQRVLPCAATSIWIYPEGWNPLEQLIAMADPLIPEALAVGRRVCTGAEGLLPERGAQPGRRITLPPGSWRVQLQHGPRMGASSARWRILSEPDGVILREVSLDAAGGAAEVILGQPNAPTRLRMLLLAGGDAPPRLYGLAVAARDAPLPAGCLFSPGG